MEGVDVATHMVIKRIKKENVLCWDLMILHFGAGNINLSLAWRVGTEGCSHPTPP